MSPTFGMRAMLRMILTVLVSVAAGGVSRGQSDPLPRLGVGVKASTLGVGVEVATAVSRRANLRFGFNGFGYDYTFRKDGIDYASRLQLRSVQATYDWLWRGVHLSPGVLLYNGNQASGAASVSGGRSFTLNGVRYYSDAANPVVGRSTISLHKYRVAPMALVGFGNLLPRSSRRFSVSLDFGAVYMGAPETTLNLTGATCTAPNVNCQSISTNPVVQANIVAQQAKINHDLERARLYPVISLGIGWKFR